MVSYSMFRPFTAELLIVLILIVVDNGLVPQIRGSLKHWGFMVLILIVVDNGLVHLMDIARYFNGDWS